MIIINKVQQNNIIKANIFNINFYFININS